VLINYTDFFYEHNKIVKGCGGAIGLLQNPVLLRQWLLSGPEQSRILMDFEDDLGISGETSCDNHDSGYSSQKPFHGQVRRLYDTIVEMGNPFMDHFPELVNLNRQCASRSTVECIRTLEDTGKSQFAEFSRTVLDDRTETIHKPIKRNILHLFNCGKKTVAKTMLKLIELREDVALFGQLYVSLQNRSGDMQEFSHETTDYNPPSLSDHGSIYFTKKSDLLACMPEADDDSMETPRAFDCKIVDGAVIIHALPRMSAKTFEEYSTKVFVPYILQQLETSARLDIVWDTYIPDSLKVATRQRRGTGNRIKVGHQTKLPSKWEEFLKVDENKQELFDYLNATVACITLPPGKELIMSGTI